MLLLLEDLLTDYSNLLQYVLKDLSIKNLICIYENAISIVYVNKKNRKKIWDIQKNIEAEEKWAQKREEQEKRIKKNNSALNG